MPDFDELLFIRSLMDRPADAKRFSQYMQPEWLQTVEYRILLDKVYEFTKQFTVPPSVEALRKVFIDEDRTAYNTRYKDTIDKLEKVTLEQSEVLYCLDQAKKVGIVWSLERMFNDPAFIQKRETKDGAEVMHDIQEWITQFDGTNEDVEMRIDDAVEKLIKDRGWMSKNTEIPCGIEFIDDWCGGGLRPKQLGLILAPTGHGKCLVGHTKILMYDGRLQQVKDIKTGDKLMGPDSLPRTVLGTTKGYGELYDVIPVKGQKFTCNADHILSLEYTGGNEAKRGITKVKGYKYNISIKDYLKQSKTQKHLQKLWRVGVEFQYTPVEFDPYLVGLYLGDGTRKAPQITVGVKDVEILDYLNEWAGQNNHNVSIKERNGCWHIGFSNSFKRHKNKIIKLRKQLINDKGEQVIPHTYKASSEKDRLQLLAGLLDSDGSLQQGSFDYITKYKTLAEDVIFVARSLGFGANISECKKSIKSTGFIGTYYRINITGDTNRIPCKLPRKQAKPRKQKKSVLRTGFKIVPAGTGDYYGFELDGDHLFLLEDFTVSHNSTCLMIMAHKMSLLQGQRVLFISNELSMGEITERFGAMISGEDISTVVHEPTVIRRGMETLTKWGFHDRLWLAEVNREISTDDIEGMIARYINLYGWKPDVVVIDFMERMKPTTSGHKRDQTWNWYGAIAQDLIRFAKRAGLLVWTAGQTNRSGMNNKVEQSMGQAQGSIRHLQECSAVIGLRQRSELDNESKPEIRMLEFLALKMRHSKRSETGLLVEANLGKMSISKNYRSLKEWQATNSEGDDKDLPSSKKEFESI